MRRFLGKLTRSYWNTLRKRPYTTNVVQAAIFMATGDVLAQSADMWASERPYDLTRTAKMAGVGAVIGPFLVFYYKCLDSIVAIEGTCFKKTIIKISIDQIVMAPTSIIALVVLTSAAEGKDVSKSLEDKTVGLLMDNYKVWPAAQVINFTLVPPPLRAGFHQIVALGWNSYVNWKLHSNGEIENKLIPLNYGNKGYPKEDDS
uniref:Mitochondrial inner membrane protein Mpv17 n=1 Tax=Lygus hesperus TaxID=30085 RepID=A0A0A9YN67_LYGHE